MSWKLPLNQIGSGSTFIFGQQLETPRFKQTTLSVEQHPWLSEILDELDCRTAGSEANFAIQLDVEKQSETYRVKAKLRMIPKLECVRSLTEFRSDVITETEALYVKSAETPQGGEHEMSESELESYEHDGSGLMLSEFVTDLIYTSLPDFPLCQPECKGLCTECGCNLNDARECASKSKSQKDFDCPSLKYFQ
ncbi:MAG: DUF177 domain-containing protein [Betaproteobacteria bacterium]|nr:DUF177 domain-containing protein [Betaproteobacteria bacterium]